MDKKRLLQDLIDGLQTRGMKKKEAEDFIRLYFDTIQKRPAQRQDYVKVNGIGTFKLIEVEARNSVNVNTGEAVQIPEHLKLSFISDTTFKDAINKPFADFEPVEATAEKTPISPGTHHVEKPTVEKPTVKEPTVQERKSSIASEPTKQPGIQEMLDQLITKEQPMKQEKPHRPVRTILLIVSGILLIAGLTIWSIVSNQSAQKDFSENLKLVEAYNLEDTTGISEEPVLIENPAVDDTIETVTAPVNQATKVKEPATIPTTEKPAPKRSIPTSVVVGAGDRLTLIAQKYYGHKIFWVYIYMENKDAISNPNDVPVGTSIRLPDKHPTVMDPNNAQSIKKAEELQDRIINQLQSSRSN